MLSGHAICSIIEENTQNGGTVTFSDQTKQEDVLRCYRVEIKRGSVIARGEGCTVGTALDNAYDMIGLLLIKNLCST